MGVMEEGLTIYICKRERERGVGRKDGERED